MVSMDNLHTLFPPLESPSEFLSPVHLQLSNSTHPSNVTSQPLLQKTLVTSCLLPSLGQTPPLGSQGAQWHDLWAPISWPYLRPPPTRPKVPQLSDHALVPTSKFRALAPINLYLFICT